MSSTSHTIATRIRDARSDVDAVDRAAREFVESSLRTRAPIVRPAIGDRHGHPVLFDRSVFDELRRAPLEHGAKVVAHEHADRLINVEVSDTRCLIDVDTPAEYNALVHGAERERE